MTIALLFSLGKCVVQIESVGGKLCLHKKTFQSQGRSDYQYPACASVCQMRNFIFEDQTSSFFLLLGQGVYIFNDTPKSIQDVIGDV